MKKIFYLIVCFAIFYCNSIEAQISGTVFRDYNANGVKDNTPTFNEVGLGSITATAYDTTGAIVGAATSASDGTYTITGVSGAVRVEFTGLQSGDYSSTAGGTSVQFVAAPVSGVNFAVNYPNDYSQSDPDIITPLYLNGAAQAGDKSMVSFAYSLSGNPGGVGVTNETFSDQTGSVWGLAYDTHNKMLYASAFLKRHVGLLDNNGDGTGDLGAIYVKNFTTNLSSLWLDVTTLPGCDVGLSLLPNQATRNLPTGDNVPSLDPGVFPLIGKIGIGDIDISDDFTTLYFVNLYDKKLYAVDIASKTLVSGFPVAIPNECDPAKGDLRPFALKIYRNEVYVGAVCDAALSNSAADLSANVYRLNGASFTNVLSFPLNYSKGYVWIGDPASCTGITGWYPWLTSLTIQNCNVGNSLYPQPILSDIEFDVDNDMVIAFMDRTGHQLGKYNTLPDNSALSSGLSGGDILRAQRVGSNFVLESNGISNGMTATGSGNGQGPGGGEFYSGDRWFNSFTEQHQETSFGALAVRKGSNEIAMVSMDPVDGNTSLKNAGGITYLNRTTGNKSDGILLYADWDNGNFSKANGLGDIEILSDPAPLEIGNRVWDDSNNANGIQDAGEAGIDEVVVELYEGVTKVGQTTTANGGLWYFNNSNVNLNGATKLKPNTAYVIRVLNTQFPSGKTLTISNIGGAGQPDVRDSDASLVSGNAEIAYTTGDYGQNNHTLDMGFRAAAPCVTTPDTLLVCSGTSAPTSFDLPDATGGDTWSLLYKPSGTTASIDATTGLISNLSTAGDYVAILTGASCPDTVHIVQPACNFPCVCYQSAVEGYADFSALGTTIISGAASNFFSASIPGHGAMTVSYNITAGGRIRQEPTTFTSLDALAYTSLYATDVPWPVQPIYLETSAGNTQNITFTFDTAIADFDFIVFDVDQNDQVVITATDANGNVITDLSSWIVHGMGDATTAVASGQSPGTVGATPIYNAATGTITSPSNVNHNRPFVAIHPDNLIKSISISFTSSTTGNHVYFDIYGMISSPSAPCCACPPVVCRPVTILKK